MPKNKGKGKGKGNSRSSNQLRIADSDSNERYALVQKPLGSAQFRIRFLNGEESIGKAKGSMTRGRGFEKITPDNWVLVQQDGCTTGKEKYYIIHLYNQGEKKQLEKLGELASVVDDNHIESAFVFEGDETVQKQTEAEVDDSFINDI